MANSIDQDLLVEMTDVSLRYGAGKGDSVLAVEDLDLRVFRKDFLAVVGPSGCGKSSLMKLMTGLMPPNAGEIRIGDQPVRRPVEGVGMAFQNATLLPWRTTLDNVMLPFEVASPHKYRLRSNRSEYVGRAERLLATVGLGNFFSRFPWQLSGGMQQRVNLCRALVHEPGLLMLDEPFGALDAFTREELWSVMQNLWMQRQFTAVLVTHDLREAVYLSNRIVVMSNRPGRIVHEVQVDLPRPRTLDMTFDNSFNDIVRDLRSRISHEMSP